MAKICIITPTPGPTTVEKILELIGDSPEGITVSQIQQTLNRPVSMLQKCLKTLISQGKIYVRLSENRMQRVYYPAQKKLGNNSN